MISVCSVSTLAQQRYGVSPYPDVWYNSVDGIRLGVRVIGEEIGAFKEGPHQLDAGIWLGTNIPDQPVSYYFSLTEPIQAISGFAEEGSIQIITSVRTGFAQHRFQFNKRWQGGFNENDYITLSVFYSQEKMFDEVYRPYPELWQDAWKSLLGFELKRGHELYGIQLLGKINSEYNLHENSGNYSHLKGFLIQKVQINDIITFRAREFAGFNGGETAPENRFFFSLPTFSEQLTFGNSRAEGTTPTNWLEGGKFQLSGQTIIRGYMDQDYFALQKSTSDPSMGFYSFFDQILGFNIDMEFRNPIQKMLTNSLAKNMVEFRSYLFFDGAKGYGDFARKAQDESLNIINYYTYSNSAKFSSGAGLQISFNIPDYLANDRGIFLRYEIPFWLSSPQQGDPNFKYRTLIGVGAIFSF